MRRSEKPLRTDRAFMPSLLVQAQKAIKREVSTVKVEMTDSVPAISLTKSS
jgi:hypothetical protein